MVGLLYMVLPYYGQDEFMLAGHTVLRLSEVNRIGMLLIFSNNLEYETGVACLGNVVTGKYVPAGIDFRNGKYVGGKQGVVVATTVCNQHLQSYLWPLTDYPGENTDG